MNKIAIDSADIKVKVDFSKFQDKIKEAQEYLDRQIIIDTQDFVPYVSGKLNDSVYANTELGSGKIVYKTPYAHYQYVGISKKGKPFNYTKTYHSMACSKWFAESKIINKAKWVKEVKRICGGH